MEQGMDPEVRRLFIQVLNSMALVILWLLLMILLGLRFKMATCDCLYLNIAFYSIAAISLFFLIIQLIKIWKKPSA